MILFHVQHLLGTGHVQRIHLLAEELARRGFPVTVLSGGMPTAHRPPPGVTWVQLEPVRSRDLAFSELVDGDGVVAGPALFDRRRQAVVSACRQARPTVVVVESFPFGRRPFAGEIDALLGAARDQGRAPTVAVSIRDILQRRSPRREDETVARLLRDFDAVLVHGDPRVASLAVSFAAAERVAERLVYTGYVSPSPVLGVPRAASGEVVVSAGGGAAGLRLYQAAAGAARRDHRRWRLLVGPGIGEEDFQALRRMAGDARVERNRSDFRDLLREAGMLVSQAGYNTVVDVLVSGVRSVLVPFAGSGETEQRQRAACFQQLGRCGVVDEDCLDADTLLAAVHAAATAAVSRPEVDLRGIAATADWLGRHA